MESYITEYPLDGDNKVTLIHFVENYEKVNGNDIIYLDQVYQMGRVYINDTQFFQGAPLIAWHFLIGGYQPAQKWLKDRKGRELTLKDILYYQKIIVALFETNRIMNEIDMINIE